MTTSTEGSRLNPLHHRPGDPTYAARHRLPDAGMDPLTAFHSVRDETMLDGNARLNLATFVTTWMEEEASELYREAFDKNMIDKDEYPQTAAIEQRCQHIIADLWHAPDPDTAPATSTVGSSEACMLAGIALKRRWQQRRTDTGKDTSRPNLVMSSAVQVCWEKFCNYFEVEPRFVPVSEEHPVLDGSALDAVVDEHTIGVVGILGVTYTGAYEPIAEIAAALDAIERERGLDIPIHVDAASGGMIAPFLQPELEWDFRLARVASINTSGHKYGLVYPGLGWVVWRDAAALPESMVFRVSYLGGDTPTLALNFSRPGAQVLLQFFLFLRLGREGYTAVQGESQRVALHLSSAIGDMPAFALVSDGSTIPVFAWRLRPGHTKNWTLYDLSDRLRMRGWLVPAYPMPDDLAELTVQRIVVRNGLTIELADSLLDAIREETAYLDALTSPLPHPTAHPAFSH
ncbi:glutamate decarboxylase [Leucobacter chromiireducens]|uniref:Glutamate decarboxylase n=1 Tax=Leucobacter chromiireducens subsp. solipictus TaxID=398235 RepID=A0ABS1SEG5_9MICO|nr:glutamate decarboxylase [Leucobacter chromiireducens]MBL3678452.1 glutamate decarboxylase [Leucobacter chromiireducens subsp. solipictus]